MTLVTSRILAADVLANACDQIQKFGRTLYSDSEVTQERGGHEPMFNASTICN